MGRVKAEWIYLLLAVLMTAGLSAAAVFAYFSEDRWAAFGTIGTWVTGTLAGMIAVAQFMDIRARKQNLFLRSRDSLDAKLLAVLERLIGVTMVFNSISSRYLSDKKRADLSQTDILNLIAMVQPELEKLSTISLNETEQEYLSHEIDNDVSGMNAEINRLKMSFGTYMSEKRFPEIITEAQMRLFARSVNRILVHLSRVSPDNLHLYMLGGVIKKLLASIPQDLDA